MAACIVFFFMNFADYILCFIEYFMCVIQIFFNKNKYKDQQSYFFFFLAKTTDCASFLF
jgi:hypothetical protein